MGVAAVAAGLGQACIRQGCMELHVIEHALHEGHATPGSDFFVRKTQFKVSANPCTEIAMNHFIQESPNFP
jgi:hypothetical protein